MRLSDRLVAASAVVGLLGAVPLAANAAPARTRPAARTAAAPMAARAARAAQAAQAAQATPGPSGIAAKGAYLYDADTAKKLWGVATTTQRPIGSITKMMTAVIVLRAGNLDKTVTIKKSYVDHVRDHDASGAGLRTGDKVTVRQP